MKKLLFILSFLFVFIGLNAQEIIETSELIQDTARLKDLSSAPTPMASFGSVYSRDDTLRYLDSSGNEWNLHIPDSIPKIDFYRDQAAFGHRPYRIFPDTANNTIGIYIEEVDVTGQLMRELWLPNVLNTSGGTFDNGTVVYLDTTAGTMPTVSKANAKLITTSTGVIGMVTHDAESSSTVPIVVTTNGLVRDLPTNGMVIGQAVYADTIDGGYTNIRPEYPNHTLQIGTVMKVGLSDGQINMNVIGRVQDILDNGWNGDFLEGFDFRTTVVGGVVKGYLSRSDGSEFLTMNFSDGFTLLDVSPADTINLTAGTDDNPQRNYVYILKSGKVLAVSTSDWPTTEQIRVATIELRSAATTDTDGALGNQNWNDHLAGVQGARGHIMHLSDWIRLNPAKYISGAKGSATIVGASSPDDVYLATTGGVISQLHRQTWDATDMQTGDDIHVFNDPVAAWKTVSNLNGELTDASGGSLSNRSFSFVLWGIQNKTGEASHMILNLPSNSYNSAASAISDALNFSVYTIPQDYISKAFLIARFTFSHSPSGSGTWTLEATEDLTGRFPNTSAGGGAGGTGVTTYLGLTDTDNTYTGSAGFLPTVNGAETALEFIDSLNLTNGTFSDSLFAGWLRAGDGTLNSPGIGFTDDPDNGFYKTGTNAFAAVTGGTAIVTFGSSNQFTTLGQLGIMDGSVGVPGIAFSGDTDNGFYKTGTNAFAASTAGTDAMTFGAAQQIGIFGVFNSTSANPIFNLIDSDNTVQRLNSNAGILRWDADLNDILANSELQGWVDGVEEFSVNPGGVVVTDSLTVADRAYNTTTWNGSFRVPTSNSIRDKFVTSDAAVALNTTHRSSDGSDHSFLDQTVVIASSPVFVTVKLSGLGDGKVPVHTDDATGLEDSPISISGTDVGINIAAPQGHLDVNTEVAETTNLYINGEVNQDKFLKVRQKNASEAAGGAINLVYFGSNVDDEGVVGIITAAGAFVNVMKFTEAGLVTLIDDIVVTGDVQGATVTPTGLTTGFFPYKTAGAIGDSPLYTDGIVAGLNTTAPQGQFDINTELAEATELFINGEVSQNKYVKIRQFNASEAGGVNNLVYIASKSDDKGVIGTINGSGTEVDAIEFTETGGVTLASTLDITTVAAEGSDVDKFLVLSGTLVNYRTGTQMLSDIGGASTSHKDTHDPEDGSDALDTATPLELAIVQAGATGTSHSFARADHTHQIQHAITDNHLVTIDHATVADNDYAKFTANGLEGRSFAEVKSDLSLDNVTNESKATMFTNPTFTGTVTIPSPFTLGATSVTATGTELNILDGATLSTVELNYVDGVTSLIQDQIDTKLNPDITDTFTAEMDFNGANLIIKDLDSLAFGDLGVADSYIMWDATKLQIASSNDHYLTDISGTAQFNTNSTGVNIPSGKTYQIAGVPISVTLEVELTLNNGQIDALNGTPITLITSPGGGTVIEIISASAFYDYGSGGTARGSIVVSVGNVSGANQATWNTGLLFNKADRFSRGSISNTAASSLIPNEDMQIRAASDTVGTGDELTVYVTYRIITP